MKWDAEKYDAVKAPQISAGRELIAMANVRENDAILDLGCGTGKLTVELAQLALRGSVVGLDPSQEMLDKAQEVSAGMKNVRLVHAPAQAMNFTGEFDLVFSNSAFQWVRAQEDAMGRVYRSLKQGGRIAFQTPGNNFCKEFSDYTAASIKLLGLERFYANWQSPWRFLGKEEFESLLMTAGFRSLKVFYRDYRLQFADTGSVLAWWASAGLRPYLEPLQENDQLRFKAAFAEQFEKNRTDCGIEFWFRRLFAFAVKTACRSRVRTRPPRPWSRNGHTMVNLRPIRAEDIADIENWPPYSDGFEQMDYALRKNGWLDEFWSKPGVRIFVAESDGQVAGFSLLNLTAEGEAEFRIAMHPCSIGKGLGRQAALATMTAGFRQLGLQRISLIVRKSNPRAARLYASMGFKKTGESSHTIQGVRIEFIDMIMVKEDFSNLYNEEDA